MPMNKLRADTSEHSLMLDAVIVIHIPYLNIIYAQVCPFLCLFVTNLGLLKHRSRKVFLRLIYYDQIKKYSFMVLMCIVAG